MPWKECNLMSLKKEFVMLAIKADSNFKRLCRRFGISRKTGYKWLSRFNSAQDAGLLEHSRRPHHSPSQTSSRLEADILSVRDKHHAWGGRKIRTYLLRQHYDSIPAASTITRILQRNGRIVPGDAQKTTAWKRFEREHPNDLWQMDFKGHFALERGRCHPFTILDDHSRYCVCLQACRNENRSTVQGHLVNVFHQYGLPYQINIDNGPPWGAGYLYQFTTLSLWLIRLGIQISFSSPNHPQTNGKDERFHRTLKAEVLQGRYFKVLSDSQAAFDEWRPVYNMERPHEALNMGVPADFYEPSKRDFPEILPQIQYSPGDQIRKVDIHGRINFQGRLFRVSKALKGQYVAVRPTTIDGLYKAYYCRQLIRTINFKEQNEQY